jgi:ABC-type multidrug transport system fused ATPase/permease subunit
MKKNNSYKDFLKVLKKYFSPYKKAIKIAMVFVVLEHLMFVSAPIFFGKAVDSVISQKAFGLSAAIFLLSWFAIDILGNWFLRIRYMRASVIAYNVSADLIAGSINHLMRLPLSYHKDKKVGEVIQRFSRADQYFYQLVDQGMFRILPSLLSSAIALGVIVWIRWQLGLIYFVYILFYVLVTIRKTKPIIVYQKKTNKLFETIYGNIFDRTPNILNIKSNNTEDIEHERNVKGFEKGGIYNFNHVRMWMDLTKWQFWISDLGFLFIFGSAMYFVSVGSVTIGQFVILITYMWMFVETVNTLGGQYKTFQEGMVTIMRSEKIFNQQQESYDAVGALRISSAEGNVDFKKVTFAYDKENVLKNISFSVKAGQMIAIVGKSGEGKSTLMQMLSRYLIPKSGKILLDGKDIQTLDLRDYRGLIGIVQQEVNLFNDTICNNIRYARPGASDKDVIEAAKLANCHEFIDKFPKKYRQVVGERGVKLSTGQKQRVAIAQAILRNPRILILDEATSALDSESEKLVQEALEKVMEGRTTFVIAHRLSTIRKADLIIVLENGSIVEMGDHAELASHGGVYQKLVELQRVNV